MAYKVIPCGTPVLTRIGQIEALVTGICIRDQSLSYELSYFANGENKCVWVRPYEFTVDDRAPKKAGLVNYEAPAADPGVDISHQLPPPTTPH